MIRVMSVRVQAIATVVVLTAVVVVAYRNHHRSPPSYHPLVGVLVARTTIPKGTTGAAIGERRLYKRGEVSRSQLRNGAIFSPTAFVGRFELVAKKVTLRNIRQGSVLTPGDFGRATR